MANSGHLTIILKCIFLLFQQVIIVSCCLLFQYLLICIRIFLYWQSVSQLLSNYSQNIKNLYNKSNRNKQKMFSIFNTFVFILFYTCCLCYPESFNFIQNWDFELTPMDGVYTIDYAEKWKSKSINVNTYPKFQSAGQYLDLQDYFNENGQAEQEMKLPLNRKCQLNYFYWGYNASKFYSYVMQVYWNGQLLLTKTAQTIEPKFSQPLFLEVTKQLNTLKFREIGINLPYPQDDCSGMFVDNVSLVCPTYSVQATQRQYLKLLSIFLVASSFKLSPQFLLSFGQVFDDLQFYSFHNKHYPKTVQYFLSKAELIQLGRFKQFYQQFLWFIQQTPNITLFPPNKMQQYIEISSIKQKQLFFAKSFYADCSGNILFALTLFIAFKIVKLLLLWLQKHFDFAKKMYIYVDKNSQFWIYFSSIVQGNLTSIAWSFGIQALLLSCVNGLQKFNVVISISIFFIGLFYSTVFYPRLFSLKNKERSKMVLVCCKYNSKSYFYQPFLLLIKLVCRSYIHSFCLNNYTLQIFCLAFCDLLCISLCIKMKKSFENIPIFLCYLIYNIAFSVFDIFFYLETTQVITNTESYREIFGLVTVLIIIASNSLVILILLFCSVKSILKLVLKKIKECTNVQNKIQPCSRNKNKKTKKKILLKLKDSQSQMKGSVKIERKETSTKQRSKVLLNVNRKVEESKTVAKVKPKSNLDKIKRQRA